MDNRKRYSTSKLQYTSIVAEVLASISTFAGSIGTKHEAMKIILCTASALYLIFSFFLIHRFIFAKPSKPVDLIIRSTKQD